MDRYLPLKISHHVILAFLKKIQIMKLHSPQKKELRNKKKFYVLPLNNIIANNTQKYFT